MHPRRERPNMSRIIAVHSFRGGTGKSNTTASIAAVLAAEGHRIGVVDADIQSPGIHILFGVDQETLSHSLNDYLWGRCSIEQAAHEVTLLSIAMSNALVIIMRPDQQDYEGTSVTISVARKLRVPNMMLAVNRTPTVFDFAEVKDRVEKIYECEVAAVLPHSDELMVLSSAGIFALKYPDHPVTGLYRQVATRLMA